MSRQKAKALNDDATVEDDFIDDDDSETYEDDDFEDDVPPPLEVLPSSARRNRPLTATRRHDHDQQQPQSLGATPRGAAASMSHSGTTPPRAPQQATATGGSDDDSSPGDPLEDTRDQNDALNDGGDNDDDSYGDDAFEEAPGDGVPEVVVQSGTFRAVSPASSQTVRQSNLTSSMTDLDETYDEAEAFTGMFDVSTVPGETMRGLAAALLSSTSPPDGNHLSPAGSSPYNSDGDHPDGSSHPQTQSNKLTPLQRRQQKVAVERVMLLTAVETAVRQTHKVMVDTVAALETEELFVTLAREPVGGDDAGTVCRRVHDVVLELVTSSKYALDEAASIVVQRWEPVAHRDSSPEERNGDDDGDGVSLMTLLIHALELSSAVHERISAAPTAVEGHSAFINFSTLEADACVAALKLISGKLSATMVKMLATPENHKAHDSSSMQDWRWLPRCMRLVCLSSVSSSRVAQRFIDEFRPLFVTAILLEARSAEGELCQHHQHPFMDIWVDALSGVSQSLMAVVAAYNHADEAMAEATTASFWLEWLSSLLNALGTGTVMQDVSSVLQPKKNGESEPSANSIAGLFARCINPGVRRGSTAVGPCELARLPPLRGDSWCQWLGAVLTHVCLPGLQCSVWAFPPSISASLLSLARYITSEWKGVGVVVSPMATQWYISLHQLMRLHTSACREVHMHSDAAQAQRAQVLVTRGLDMVYDLSDMVPEVEVMGKMDDLEHAVMSNSWCTVFRDAVRDLAALVRCHEGAGTSIGAFVAAAAAHTASMVLVGVSTYFSSTHERGDAAVAAATTLIDSFSEFLTSVPATAVVTPVPDVAPFTPKALVAAVIKDMVDVASGPLYQMLTAAAAIDIFGKIADFAVTIMAGSQRTATLETADRLVDGMPNAVKSFQGALERSQRRGSVSLMPMASTVVGPSAVRGGEAADGVLPMPPTETGRRASLSRLVDQLRLPAWLPSFSMTRMTLRMISSCASALSAISWSEAPPSACDAALSASMASIRLLAVPPTYLYPALTTVGRGRFEPDWDTEVALDDALVRSVTWWTKLMSQQAMPSWTRPFADLLIEVSGCLDWIWKGHAAPYLSQPATGDDQGDAQPPRTTHERLMSSGVPQLQLTPMWHEMLLRCFEAAASALTHEPPSTAFSADRTNLIVVTFRFIETIVGNAVNPAATRMIRSVAPSSLGFVPDDFTPTHIPLKALADFFQALIVSVSPASSLCEAAKLPCGQMDDMVRSLASDSWWLDAHRCMMTSNDDGFSDFAVQTWCCGTQLHAAVLQMAAGDLTRFADVDPATTLKRSWRLMRVNSHNDAVRAFVLKNRRYCSVITVLLETMYAESCKSYLDGESIKGVGTPRSVFEVFDAWQGDALPWVVLEVGESNVLLPALLRIEADKKALVESRISAQMEGALSHKVSALMSEWQRERDLITSEELCASSWIQVNWAAVEMQRAQVTSLIDSVLELSTQPLLSPLGPAPSPLVAEGASCPVQSVGSTAATVEVTTIATPVVLTMQSEDSRHAVDEDVVLLDTSEPCGAALDTAASFPLVPVQPPELELAARNQAMLIELVDVCGELLAQHSMAAAHLWHECLSQEQPAINMATEVVIAPSYHQDRPVTTPPLGIWLEGQHNMLTQLLEKSRELLVQHSVSVAELWQESAPKLTAPKLLHLSVETVDQPVTATQDDVAEASAHSQTASIEACRVPFAEVATWEGENEYESSMRAAHQALDIATSLVQESHVGGEMPPSTPNSARSTSETAMPPRSCSHFHSSDAVDASPVAPLPEYPPLPLSTATGESTHRTSWAGGSWMLHPTTPQHDDPSSKAAVTLLLHRFDDMWTDMHVDRDREPAGVQKCYAMLRTSVEQNRCVDETVSEVASTMLRDLRRIQDRAILVAKAIEQREAIKDKLHDFVVRYERTPHFFTAGLVDSVLSTFLHDLRQASIRIVERITAWRGAQRDYFSKWNHWEGSVRDADEHFGTPTLEGTDGEGDGSGFLHHSHSMSPILGMEPDMGSAFFVLQRHSTVDLGASRGASPERVSAPTMFLYRGVNYLEKMKQDLHFLNESSLRRFLHIEVERNVVLMAKKRATVDVTLTEQDFREQSFFARISAPKGTLPISRAAGHLDPDEYGIKEMQKALDDEKSANAWFRGLTAEEKQVVPPVKVMGQKVPKFDMFRVLVPHNWMNQLKRDTTSPTSPRSGPVSAINVVPPVGRLNRPRSAQLFPPASASSSGRPSSAQVRANVSPVDSRLEMFATLAESKKKESLMSQSYSDGRPLSKLRQKLQAIHDRVPSSADHLTRLVRRHPLEKFASLPRAARTSGWLGDKNRTAASVAASHEASFIPPILVTDLANDTPPIPLTPIINRLSVPQPNASGMVLPTHSKARKCSPIGGARYSVASSHSAALAAAAAVSIVSARSGAASSHPGGAVDGVPASSVGVPAHAYGTIPPGLDGVFVVCIAIFFYRKVRQCAKERRSATKIQRWYRRSVAQAHFGIMIENALAATSEILAWWLETLDGGGNPLRPDPSCSSPGEDGDGASNTTDSSLDPCEEVSDDNFKRPTSNVTKHAPSANGRRRSVIRTEATGMRSLSRAVPKYANALQLFRIFSVASMKIQRLYRSSKRREKIKALIGKTIASVRLQRWWLRQRQAQRLLGAAHVLACTQTIVRWFRYRRQRAAEHLRCRRWRNTIRIQRWFRIRQARRALQQLRHQHASAITIQRIIRGVLGRKKAAAAQRVSVIVQFIKSKLWHRELAQLLIYKEVARRVMQAVWRARSMRELEKLRAAKRQRLRIYLKADASAVEGRAASKILACYRGWKTRSRVSHWIQTCDEVCRMKLEDQPPAAVDALMQKGKPGSSPAPTHRISVTWYVGRVLAAEYAPVATTIQCFIRKSLARIHLLRLRHERRVRDVHFAAWLVGYRRLRNFRMQCMRKAAVRFMEILTVVKHRQELERLRREAEEAAHHRMLTMCATAIQSAWRMHHTRLRFEEALVERRTADAASHAHEWVVDRVVGAQRMVRCFLRMQHWRRVLQNRRTISSRRIQRAWRMVMARQKALLDQLERHRARSLAAFKIQAWFRACVESRAATYIQGEEEYDDDDDDSLYSDV